MEEFGRSLDNAFEKYFSQYGRKQIHLWLLATHPDFRRRGVGSKLCRWGIEMAKPRGWPATVLASPMGSQLYKGLGFKLLGSITVQVEGEREKLIVECLEKRA